MYPDATESGALSFHMFSCSESKMKPKKCVWQTTDLSWKILVQYAKSKILFVPVCIILMFYLGAQLPLCPNPKSDQNIDCSSDTLHPCVALYPSLNPPRATEQLELGLHLTSRLLCISTSLRCLIGPNAGFNLHFLSRPPRFAWLFQSAAGLLCLSGGAVGFRRQPLPERGGGRTRSGTPAADCVSPLYAWPKFTAPLDTLSAFWAGPERGDCLFV